MEGLLDEVIFKITSKGQERFSIWKVQRRKPEADKNNLCISINFEYIRPVVIYFRYLMNDFLALSRERRMGTK